jgi:hypothetical protein
MTGNTPEIGFGYFGMLELDNAEGRMESVVVVAKVGWTLGPFSVWSRCRWGNLWCDGWFRFHVTCRIEVWVCMGLGRPLATV